MARRKYFERMDFARQPEIELYHTASRAGAALWQLLLLAILPIGLASPCDELELAAFHLLLEHTELGLLPDVEHLIERLVRASRVSLAAAIDLLQLLERVLQHTFVGLSLHQQTAEDVEHARPLLQRLPPRVEQRLESRQKLRVRL